MRCRGGCFLGKPRPISRRNRREVRFHCEAPGNLAGGMVVRGARCLARWLLCLADGRAVNAAAATKTSALRFARALELRRRSAMRQLLVWGRARTNHLHSRIT